MGEKSAFLAVGHVKDAHGIKGEVYVRLFAPEGADWAEELEEVRFKSRATGEVRTFEVARQRFHKEGLVLQLKGIVDRNAAELLKGFTFELAESELVAKAGETPYLHEVLGFEIHDLTLGAIGKIKEFFFNGAQDLFIVQYGEREVMIPFVQAFVKNIDFDQKRVEMDLPPGLLEN